MNKDEIQKQIDELKASMNNKSTGKKQPVAKGRLDVALWQNHSEKAGVYYVVDIGGVLKIPLFISKKEGGTNGKNFKGFPN